MGSVVRLTAAAAILVVLAACGSDEPDDDQYGPANREAFLAACTDSGVDGVLVRDICECTYSRLVETVSLAELDRIEETLRLDTLAPLPDEVADLVAECVVAEADL